MRVVLLLLVVSVNVVRIAASDDDSCPAGSSDCINEPLAQSLVDTYESTSQCEEWAKKCECQENPSFMLVSCKRSCHLFGSSCDDKHPKCKKFRPKKDCDGKQWKHCPGTCRSWKQSQVNVQKESKCKRKEHPGGLQDTPITAMFERIANSTWAQRYKPKVLSSDPWMIYLEEFLTHAQVDNLLAAVRDSGLKFEASFELQTGHSQRRKSESLFCVAPGCSLDERVLEVHNVATNLTGLPLPMHEYMQILKYAPGDFYVSHQDTSNDYGRAAHGHRIYTLFLYLSDLPPGSGGETHFPKLDLKVPPKKGAAVIWTNVNAEDTRQEEFRSNHAGLPVDNSSWGDENSGNTFKLGANMWLYGYDWRELFHSGCMNEDAKY